MKAGVPSECLALLAGAGVVRAREGLEAKDAFLGTGC